MSKHTIWNSDATEYDFEEARRNCADANGETPEEVSDEAVWDFIHREIDQWYEDESMNLNKPTGRILCYGSLGLWWGRPTGYRMIDGGNLNAVLGQACRDSYDYHVYFDGRDVCADDTHHDGTNRYTFREIREDVGEDALDAFLDRLTGGRYRKRTWSA